MIRSLIPNRETECRVYAMIQMAHTLTTETDRIATLIAELLDIDPSSEVITEAVWNADDPAHAMALLKGERSAFDCARSEVRQ
ncbi:hypothetical protein O4H61_03435 [Roseovarius aestuarii]|nr:hypothetical protein [Roseovarius aestuarii]